MWASACTQNVSGNRASACTMTMEGNISFKDLVHDKICYDNSSINPFKYKHISVQLTT